MKKWNNKIVRTAVSSSALLAALPVVKVLAAEYDYGASDAAVGTAAAGIFGGLLIFWLIFIVIGIGFLIFWILMLVDAFKRTNWQDDNQKNMWLIILIVSIFVGLSWLAAILYYFMVKKSLGGGKTTSSAPASTPTPPPADKK